LQTIAGGLFHVRVPVKSELAGYIPKSLLSEDRGVYYIQNLVPYGNKPLNDFIQEINQRGIKFIAVTTINKHGEPEITEKTKAQEFCSSTKARQTIKILLHDSTPHRVGVEGSFLIFNAATKQIMRDGRYPPEVLEYMTGVIFDRKDMKPAVHNRADFNWLIRMGKMDQKISRALILGYSMGIFD